MWIIPAKGSAVSAERIAVALEAAVAVSRFTVWGRAWGRLGGVTCMWLGRKWAVHASPIRLRRSKPYCGQHAGPCPNGGPRNHARRSFLEALDWIGWNHLVNDVLDSLLADADVWAKIHGRYFVRRGKLRRVNYPFESFWIDRREHVEFVDGGPACFEDYCGKISPPIAGADPEDEYGDDLAGTPGIPAYTVRGEEAWRKKYPELSEAH